MVDLMTFRVWEHIFETEAGGMPIIATCPRRAAEKWAKQHDEDHGDSRIATVGATACVKAPDGSVTRWSVEADGWPQSYIATEVM